MIPLFLINLATKRREENLNYQSLVLLELYCNLEPKVSAFIKTRYDQEII